MSWVHACLVTMAAALLFPIEASAHLVTLESDLNGDFGAQEAPALRSAFLLRLTGAEREILSDGDAGRLARLHAHFDAVLAVLVAQTDRSLGIALDRLEQRRGEAWSPAEREGWRQTLAARRFVQLRRLRLYQIRGRFPINEHVADRAVPVFVDHYDTACAVGHLMRESGWGAAVSQIEATNNLVYVTDVKEGSLVDWVLQSGLTQEEAALVQPAYDPPPFDTTLDQLVAGGSLTHAGLRYDNFHFIGGLLTLPQAFPQIPPAANEVNLTEAGVAVRDTVWHDPCCGNVLGAEYEDWMFIGARTFQGLVDSDPGEQWGVIYSFDVTAENAGALIAAASVESNPNFTFNLAFGGRIDVDTAIYTPGTPPNPALALAAMHFDSTMGFGGGLLFGDVARSFAPIKKVTLVTAVRVQNDAQFTSLVHSFQVIPEPASIALGAWAFGCGVLLWARFRTNRADVRLPQVA